MTEVLFYHLTESRMEQALPGLLEKSLERGWKAVVQFGTEDMRNRFDDHLWTWRDDGFIPHAADGAEPEGNPIWLTTGRENPIHANIRFLVDNAEPVDCEPYDRVILMFDGHDAVAVAKARDIWRSQKESGHDLTYWQQDEMRWVKKQ